MSRVPSHTTAVDSQPAFFASFFFYSNATYPDLSPISRPFIFHLRYHFLSRIVESFASNTHIELRQCKH